MTRKEILRLASDVDQELRAHADARRRVQNENYFPTGLEILGVKASHIKDINRALKKRMKKEQPADVLALAHALLDQNTIEARQVAFDVIHTHKPALRSLVLKDVEALGRSMDNWVTVDTFSVLVAGQAWREGQIPIGAIRRWARSKDRWWRRAALVSTVALNLKSRGGTGDTARTLEICTLAVEDHDDMVTKALSWALREISRRDPTAVRQFLCQHDASLAARVKREVGNKLRTGKKAGA